MSDSMRMPVLFVGHGSPMNAIEDNEFSRTWQQLGQELPTPEAILCISAHWESGHSAVTGMVQPRTIHDFYGFPRELNQKQYPAPSSRKLVELVKDTVKSTPVVEDENWGFDHGAWSVLCRMYPAANIPLVQLSLNRPKPPLFHYQLGQELLPLRDQGILILGSGNMVHNLSMVLWDGGTYDWAEEYDAKLKEWILAREHDAIIHYERHGFGAELSVNSREHYLPLLYTLGASTEKEPIAFYNEKVALGSVSMRCVKFG